MDSVSKNNVLQDGLAAGPRSPDQQSAANESNASRRMRRIDDLQAEALADTDALEANLGAANGGLLRIAFQLEEAIGRTIANTDDPVARFERVAPAMDRYLQMVRQIDRLAQLSKRLASSRLDGNTTKPR